MLFGKAYAIKDLILDWFFVTRTSFLETYQVHDYSMCTTAMSSSIVKFDIKKLYEIINFDLCKIKFNDVLIQSRSHKLLNNNT